MTIRLIMSDLKHPPARSKKKRLIILMIQPLLLKKGIGLLNIYKTVGNINNGSFKSVRASLVVLCSKMRRKNECW
ncbi:hypothetical protein LX99_01688 [Mucilaginibacter oryzae]|uniref:Uncharacterized protein n=1 Tax=Mucilaginibacter oryzae TaxID=468058 RepID=A0A316HW72_9SPHI|nr:hypothetical protein LX99_01688 [Mucilaginibacter oryzae]